MPHGIQIQWQNEKQLYLHRALTFTRESVVMTSPSLRAFSPRAFACAIIIDLRNQTNVLPTMLQLSPSSTFTPLARLFIHHP
jgi:hypothetical protein